MKTRDLTGEQRRGLGQVDVDEHRGLAGEGVGDAPHHAVRRVVGTGGLAEPLGQVVYRSPTALQVHEPTLDAPTPTSTFRAPLIFTVVASGRSGHLAVFD